MTAKDQLSKPALDPAAVEARTGTIYPEGMKGVVEGRSKQALGNAAGLTRYGVNLVTLPPGAASAHRHWHTHEDEFIYILEGELTLVTDAGEQVLGPGMAAGFPGGVEDGHQLVNRSAAPARYLEVGDRDAQDGAHYPDIDLEMRKVDGVPKFFRKDGTPL